ncbi:MAG: acylphosphatase [Anaerolineae bacterium]
MADEERLEAIVHGRVQGVNFRYYTRLRARELGLKGYVRNCWDGTVEVVAEGPPQALAQLLDFLRHGPPAAVVVKVDAQWKPATGEFERFGVLY